jgi:carbamoyltransferase
MQDRVNAIKGREPFRPFAPIVREEIAHELFDLPVARSPYMQFVATCREPERYPAIVHTDGTSRVQTVSKHDHLGLYVLLERWEQATGHRMLLNTSLNIKGEPLVNDIDDARRFARATGVPVAIPAGVLS